MTTKLTKCRSYKCTSPVLLSKGCDVETPGFAHLLNALEKRYPSYEALEKDLAGKSLITKVVVLEETISEFCPYLTAYTYKCTCKEVSCRFKNNL